MIGSLLYGQHATLASTYAAIDPIVPTVHTANQIISVDVTIRHQGAAMRAAAVWNSDWVIEADDHNINVCN